MVVWNIFYFPIYWEKSSQLPNIFQRGSNHQPVIDIDTQDQCKEHLSRVPGSAGRPSDANRFHDGVCSIGKYEVLSGELASLWKMVYYDWFTYYIYPLRMVISHSYVNLPDG